MMSGVASSAVNLRSLFADANCNSDIPDLSVTDITSTSRNACRGGLFLACAGFEQHGLDYVDQALAANVAAVAWEPSAEHRAPELPAGVVGLEVPGLSARVGDIADQFFGQPSAQMTVTGITGTNGKTTVARLASSALSLLGNAAGYMGTMGYGMGDAIRPSQLTTPGCIVVHRRLRDLADAGARSVVMEVSSHGLDQGRIDGVRITTAALTNLSRDHLDYHGNFDAYGEAKAKLFTRSELQTAVVNVSDSFGAELAGRTLTAQDIIRVATDGSAANQSDVDLFAELLHANEAGLEIRFSGRFGSAEFASPMWGRFNVDNLALATGILLAHGFSLDQATEALAQLEAPEGRMQVLRSGTGPTVVVDFAHTPAALEHALKALRDHCSGRICCVFGCGGERDQGKRGLMGQAAVQYADQVVVTDDNPRHEDSTAIIHDILSGMPGTETTDVIPNRQLAILTAIGDAAETDVVLVAGKGSEDYQLVGDQRLAFSDIDVATAALGGAH